MNAEPILFVIFGVLSVVGACAVITFKNPVYSAIALIGTFFSQAGLFVVLGAYFVAVVQVIVYAGAVMVLFLFVIMLLNLGTIRTARSAAGIGRGVAIVLGVVLALEGIYIAVNVTRDTTVARVKQERTAGAASITGEQLKKISQMEVDYQLSDVEINTNYVPKVSNEAEKVENLTATQAQRLIEKLQQEMGKTERIGSVLFSKFLLPFEVTSLILLSALIGVIVLVKRDQPKAIS